MYSQSLEEQHILGYFKEFKGKLLDVGAANGMTMSNTYQLLLNGWHGIMVEPSAYLIPQLIKNMQGLDAEIINAVVGTKAGWQEFYESNGDFLSTTNQKNLEIWKEVPFKKTLVYGIHFMALKERYGDTFDFINIDVEGNSTELFLEMFKEFPTCKLWCIEHDGRQAEILEASGMNKIYESGENLIITK